MKKFLIFDIGGTFIKWAIVNEDFNILENDKYSFNGKVEGGKKLLESIGNLIVEKEKDNSFFAIGISSAGTIDYKTTEVLGVSANIKDYGGLNIRKILSNYTKSPIFVENDANAAAFGEYIEENVKNYKNLLMMTLGTDIGAGIILDGKIYRGFSGLAGEIGYQVVDNVRWGTYFSAIGLTRLVKEKNNQELDTYQILSSKDEAIMNTIEYWYQGIAKGITNLIATMNLEAIIIGGGISDSEYFDIPKIKQYVDQYLIEPQFKSSYKLFKASQGNNAAIFGMVNVIKKMF